MKRIREIYYYREMIFSLVKRDLKGRYKNSVLGIFWTFLNPLLQLLVYTIVFSVIMRAGIEDYYLFLFVALIPWIFFSSSVSGGANCILVQQDMVKKIYFPREVLPIAHVTSLFINMLLSFLVIFAVLFCTGHKIFFMGILCLPVIMLVEYVLALGIVLIVSALTVYLRDLEHLMSIFIMAWQFLTPVMYSTEMVPEEWRWAFQLNPMASVIEAYREILYYGRVPEMKTLVSAVGTGIVLFFIGWKAFDKLQRRFVEEM